MSPLSILEPLARASLWGGLVALVAGLALAALRHRLSASQRAWLWWIVAAHFLVALLPPVRLALDRPAPLAAVERAVAPVRALGALAESAAAPLSAKSLPVGSALGWAAVLLWSVGLVATSIRHLRSWRALEQAWRTSELAVLDASEDQVLRQHRTRAGALPEVGIVRNIEVPIVLGGRRPRILVPPSFLALDAEARALVLAHECAHLLRRDLVFGWLPAAAGACFWFHPCAFWVVREYAQAREEVCDALVVLRAAAGVAHRYGALLVQLGVTPRPIPTAASCRSWNARSLLRRLRMLNESTSLTAGRRWAGPILLTLAALSVVPLRIQAETPRAQGAKTTWNADQSPIDIRRFASMWVYEDGKTTEGSMWIERGDADAAVKAQRRHGGEVWWFWLDGAGWVVTDPALLGEARAIYRQQHADWERIMGPYEALSRRAGARQEEYDAKLDQLEEEHDRLVDRREELIDQRRRTSGAGRAALEQAIQDLTAQIQRLQDQRREAARLSAYASAEEGSADRQEEAAQRRMHAVELGYTKRLRALADRAVDRGLAERAPR